MATSSITHNFVISGQENVERFLDAVEESYQESLHRKSKKKLNFKFLEGEEAIEFIKGNNYMEKELIAINIHDYLNDNYYDWFGKEYNGW